MSPQRQKIELTSSQLRRSLSASLSSSRRSVQRSRQTVGPESVDSTLLYGQTKQVLENVQKQNDEVEQSATANENVGDSKSFMQMSQSTRIARDQGRKQQQVISKKLIDLNTMVQNGADPMVDLTSTVQANYYRQLATDNQNLNASVNSMTR